MENIVYDLQLFADEEDVVVVPDGEPEETAAPDEKPEEAPKEAEPVEVPEELGGLDLSQDEVKAIMAEAGQDTGADADSDKKQVQEAPVPQKPIPYERFKAELDKRHAADERIAELEKRLAEAQKSPQQVPPTPQQTATPPPAPQQTPMPTFSPEIAQQIDEAVMQQAMQMTGMTKDDVDALEYADENDAQAKTFAYAKEMARANVIGSIQQAARRQREYAQQILSNQQALVNDFNKFYEAQKAEPDYEATVQYATNEYFEAQPPGVQFAVSDAYSRVQRNTASPQDILIVQNYFRSAKDAFHNKGAAPSNQGTPQKKVTMPRAGDVAGSATSPKETISVKSLEKMVTENRIEDLPEKYQKILLGL